ncbi:MAG TPA: CBS domain-containing protein [Candidatus Dormibacteraeota bacterium]|jgi:CBS domain-containing protein|nr:CBS domain-containing protein [Candidatus Dormibacteraeota bacterium]
MTRDVRTVRAQDPVEAVVDIIVGMRVTGVPVVDDGQRCVGVVTESDILGKRGGTVAEIMTADAVTVDEAMSLAEAAEIMLTRRIRRLPVVRGDGTLVGLLTRMDLVRWFGQTRWVCEWCSYGERGLRPPNACPSCGGESWRLTSEER